MFICLFKKLFLGFKNGSFGEIFQIIGGCPVCTRISRNELNLLRELKTFHFCFLGLMGHQSMLAPGQLSLL